MAVPVHGFAADSSTSVFSSVKTYICKKECRDGVVKCAVSSSRANDSRVRLVYILGTLISHLQRNQTMRRTFIAVPILSVAAMAAALAFRPASSPAETAKTDAAAKAISSPNLPIAQAVLFSSGVGFFQREGEIEGNQRVDLSFPVQDDTRKRPPARRGKERWPRGKP
jgi:hypothetical protein